MLIGSNRWYLDNSSAIDEVTLEFTLNGGNQSFLKANLER